MSRRVLLFAKLSLCILGAGILLFSYVEKQNELTELRLAIPALAKRVKAVQEENTRLTYELEKFEDPVHLMQLMQQPEFSHLKFPYLDEQLMLRRPQALNTDKLWYECE
jgi:hypothetical protein